MTNMKDHPASTRVKALICGESGAGKTTLIGTLANAGFKARVFDFDNGLDILLALVAPASIDNISYMSFNSTDPTSIKRMLDIFKKGWHDDSEDLGSIKDWGPDTVVVLDSLTFAGQAALRAAKAQNGVAPNAQQFDRALYGVAQNTLEYDIISNLCNDAVVHCNVLVNTHIQYTENEVGIQKMFPSIGAGKALVKHIGNYFNNVWRIDVRQNGTRCIRTESDHMMSLKCSAPRTLDKEEAFDLGAVFNKILSSSKERITAASKKEAA